MVFITGKGCEIRPKKPMTIKIYSNIISFMRKVREKISRSARDKYRKQHISLTIASHKYIDIYEPNT